MNRWGVRILGLFLLVAFLLLMMNLEKQLLQLQRDRPASTSTDLRFDRIPPSTDHMGGNCISSPSVTISCRILRCSASNLS